MGSNRRLQLNELKELRNKAYESARIYKARTKVYHDKFIARKMFELNQKVWLFNSKLLLFSNKLRSRWDGLFIMTQVFLHGAIELTDPKQKNIFKINGQCLKSYLEEINDGELIESINLIYLIE